MSMQDTVDHPGGDWQDKKLDMADARVYFWPGYFPAAVADRLMAQLQSELAWAQGDVRVFGRWYKTPRLQAWHGAPGIRYTYSGHTLEAEPLTPALLTIKQHIETGPWQFNAVLGNWYRHGDDRMGWHSDDEPELGSEPVIASVSLGATRDFLFKHRTRPWRYRLALTHGSVLIMAGATQRHWLHSLPVRKKVHDSRINLTFRYIMPPTVT